MKRIIILLAVVALVGVAVAQNQAEKQQGGKPGAQTPSAPPPTTPGTKPQPQAKTQEEFQAFQQIAAQKDPRALEAGAKEFATKFPESELKWSVYYLAMVYYQQANNSNKEAEMARKVLEYHPENPVALASLATNTAERTRPTDLDRDERLNEAKKQAELALKTVDTELVVPPGTTPEQAQGFKNMIRSMAYSAMGQIEYIKENLPGAEAHLRSSLQLTPDPFTMLRLALVLDKQKKYPEALAVVDRILQSARPGSLEATKAKQERDRLVKLMGGAPATPPASGTAAPAPVPAAPAQTPK
jgi:tetratricopeptide (TPR) repeat protein